VAVTPDGKTAFVTNNVSGTVSTIDVKTRTTNPTDIHVRNGTDARRLSAPRNYPRGVAVTPDGKTAFVTLSNGVIDTGGPQGVSSNWVATIDVKTRTKNPTDIPVGSTPPTEVVAPWRVAFTPDGKTAFVASPATDTVSTIDVKTRTKNPTDIPVGSTPLNVAITPDGRTAFVTNRGSRTVSTIDVKTRTKNPTDIPVGSVGSVAITPDGKTAFVTGSDAVSTIDVKTRTKNPTDIPVGGKPLEVAITPCHR
jgi:YVTN family beta-propeller protein